MKPREVPLRWLSLPLAAACVLAGCSAELPEPAGPTSTDAAAELTAAQILDQMRTKYGSLDSYQDNGSHTEIERAEEGSSSETQWQFATWFVRETGYFRLEFNSADRTYTVLRNAEGIRAIDSRGYGSDDIESLLSALHRGNGVTNGTALMIPCMLAPEEINRSAFWGVIRQLRRVDDEMLDGNACFRLTGTYWGKGAVDFWIDKDFAIRRIRTTEPSTAHALVRNWTFHPQLDGVIAPSAFEANAN